jgi:hypothetical protein
MANEAGKGNNDYSVKCGRRLRYNTIEHTAVLSLKVY